MQDKYYADFFLPSNLFSFIMKDRFCAGAAPGQGAAAKSSLSDILHFNLQDASDSVRLITHKISQSPICQLHSYSHLNISHSNTTRTEQAYKCLKMWKNGIFNVLNDNFESYDLHQKWEERLITSVNNLQHPPRHPYNYNQRSIVEHQEKGSEDLRKSHFSPEKGVRGWVVWCQYIWTKFRLLRPSNPSLNSRDIADAFFFTGDNYLRRFSFLVSSFCIVVGWQL